MSLLIPFGKPREDFTFLTPLTAVAVSNAIEKLTETDPKIKWVNDVYLNGKKICGILTEIVNGSEPETVDSIVIGIGINISTASFPSGLEGKAGAIMSGISRREISQREISRRDVSRSALAAETVNELLDKNNREKNYILTQYRNRAYLTGKTITFSKNGVLSTAFVEGIDDNCGLMIRTEDGKTAVLTSGEVSVCGIEQ